jgi:hypothetical protein
MRPLRPAHNLRRRRLRILRRDQGRLRMPEREREEGDPDAVGRAAASLFLKGFN